MARDVKTFVRRFFRLTLLIVAPLLFGCAVQPQEDPEQPLTSESTLDTREQANGIDLLNDDVKPAETELAAAVTAPPPSFWEHFRSQMSLADQYEHPRIDRHLRWFTGNQTYFDRVIARAQKYIYYILEQVETQNLPVELALLPIIESAYDPFAYSHSHASGLWQFIPSTGKLYGLKKDWWYDGRRDVVASTGAALKYLTYLHELFDGDWLLALAAYNSGEGNVRRAITRNKRAGKPTDFWSLRLPRETKAYVPQLLAVSKVVQNPAKYSVAIANVPNEPFFSAVELSNQIDLNKAAEMAGISNELLAALNPAFNRPVTHPEGPHQLLLPTANTNPFLSSIASLPKEHWQPNKTYRVKKGDSLYTIAKKHHVTIGQLKALNGLNSNILQIDQQLALPGFGKASVSSERQLATTAYYNVRQGDTLWGIAKRQKVSVKDLMRWNQLSNDSTLQPGQQLKLTQNAYTGQNRMRKVNYRVRRGDSLSRIASKFNLSINDILHWNSLDLQNYLKPGQRLTLFVDIRNI